MDWLSTITELSVFTISVPERLSVVRAIVGFILVFFLPGFAWTIVLFQHRQVNLIERLGFSLALSIVVVTLSLLVANTLFKLTITGLNSVLVIIIVTIVPLAAYYLNRLIRRYRGKNV